MNSFGLVDIAETCGVLLCPFVQFYPVPTPSDLTIAREPLLGSPTSIGGGVVGKTENILTKCIEAMVHMMRCVKGGLLSF